MTRYIHVTSRVYIFLVSQIPLITRYRYTKCNVLCIYYTLCCFICIIIYRLYIFLKVCFFVFVLRTLMFMRRCYWIFVFEQIFNRCRCCMFLLNMLNIWDLSASILKNVCVLVLSLCCNSDVALTILSTATSMPLLYVSKWCLIYYVSFICLT